MKTTTFQRTVCVAFVAALSISPLLAAETASKPSYSELSSVSALELPAKAAAIVAQAKENQEAVLSSTLGS